MESKGAIDAILYYLHRHMHACVHIHHMEETEKKGERHLVRKCSRSNEAFLKEMRRVG